MDQNALSPHSILGLSNGTYFYIAVAYNESGQAVSNCISIVVEITPAQPPGAFTLSSTAEDPDDDGIFDLTWTTSAGADNYSLYTYSSSWITEINGSLTSLVNQAASSPHSISGLDDGTYYYIIVAENPQGMIISNCIMVIVEHSTTPPPAPPGIPGYDLLIILSSLCVISWCFYGKIRRKLFNPL
ncbi:MAG: hypothetical protein ACTSRT_11000 [Promethearchaeota archaeon]